jgi:hypothetical protein
MEILVHTSAPSRGPDDARYRALAQTYLDFEQANRIVLGGQPKSDGHDEQTNGEVQREPESQASYRPDDEPETMPSSLASSQNAQRNQISLSQALDSTDLSFNSVLDNADSPVFRERLATRSQLPTGMLAQTETQDSTDSWQQPPSTIADSQPENNPALEAYSSPTKALERFLHRMDGPKDPSFGASRLHPGKPTGTTFPAESPIELEATGMPRLSPGSPLPIAHEPTGLKSHAPRGRKKDVPYTQNQLETRKRKQSTLSSNPTQISSSLPEKRSKNAHSNVLANATRSKMAHQIESSPPEATQPKEVASIPTPTQSSSVLSSSRASYASALEIRAPPPIASVSKLTLDMLRTPSLDQLAKKMPLHILYRPQTETRELRAMERGYWLLPCKTWNEDLQRRTWDCLGNFVGKGQAGWGVWCVREEYLGSLRVYCWGAIVGHIYLLLYMASESKIKGTGASWVGGDGQAVVTMPS